MLHKAFLTVVVVAVIALCLGGCRKSSDESPAEPQPANEPAKTAVQHEADARKDITEENLEDELAKLEKAVEADIAADAEP